MTTQIDLTPEDRIKKGLSDARALKDYALRANLAVPDNLIDDLHRAELAKGDESERAAIIDRALRDLTSLTYPTTIDTINATDSAAPNRFLWALLVLAGVVLVVGVASYHSSAFPWSQSVLAVCLGLLGALVYVFFNLIGVMRERAFDPGAKFENTVRIVLGGILGWLFL